MGINYNTKSIVTDDLVLCLDAANVTSYNSTYISDPVDAQVSYTTAGTHTFEVPAGISEISAVCIGGGGGGGGSTNTEDGGGGGGGALSYGTIEVTSLEDLEVIVGSGGEQGLNIDGEDGGDSQIKRGVVSLLFAEGGEGGEYTISGSGEGGAGGTSTGTARLGGGSGGDGGTGTSSGGGGGGAGGYSGNGGNGAGSLGETANDGAGGGGGGGGGTSSTSDEYRGGGVGILGEHDPVENGEGGAANSAGEPGSGGVTSQYGGGGGGAYRGNNVTPLSGRSGAVRIVYQLPNDGTRIYPAKANTEDKTYASSAYKWNDISNNGNTGILFNIPTYSSNNGGIFNFNGSSQYVECGNVISLTAYTKSAWFRPESATKNIVSAGSGGGHAFWMQGTNNSLRAGHQGTWNRVSYTLPSGNMLNQWWNGVVTWNNSTGWVLYLNGDQVATNADITGPLSATVQIAAYNSSNYFDGDIAQVSIYDRVITAAEVLQNYNSLKGRFGL